MEYSEILETYLNEVNEIRKRAKLLNLTDYEIDTVFENYFEESSEFTHKKCGRWLLKGVVCILVILLTCYVLLYVHQPTSSIVLRNVQGLIYPGLKCVRFLSMPIIKWLTSLTELYDECCLLPNPFFYVNNMECWPCENVHSVMNLTGSNNSTLYESGRPFIVKSNQQNINLRDINSLYENNLEIFNRDASRLKSTSYNLTHISNLLSFQPNQFSDIHISWRINRMLPARILRRLFPRPTFMSEWSGQSIERFVMIDEPLAAAYELPGFECSYTFIAQASGERTIVLKPSRECGKKCKTISVVLKPTYVLWYNWWYWRPISLPVENSTNISISYLSSYC